MAKKPSKQNNIHGDVNITNGDFVAGDKTIAHRESEQTLAFEKPSKNKRPARPMSRDLNGNLDVSGGDVVFGDKIIKFFQDSLNIYVFRDVRQLVVFLGFLILVSGTIGSTYWYSIQPQKMTGDYNIAFAQFGEIFDNLEAEYKQDVLGLHIEVAKSNMPLITQDSQAEELAQKINADIVIYGNVSVQLETGQAIFRPRFYVAEQADAGELTGPGELAVPIVFSISELNTDEGLNLELPAHTEILFNFTKALIHYSQKDSESGLRAIHSSISTAERLSEPFDGQEVLYLVAAKIYMQKKDYENASQMLDRALKLNPNYARAHLGWGNIYYAQAIRQDFDTNLLLKAKTEYQFALDLPGQPEGAYIPIKAHTGLCTTVAVMAQDLMDPALFTEATEYCMYVIGEYQRTEDPFLQKYAAISYFSQGAIYESQENIEQAIDAYQEAHDLEVDEGEKERIKRQLELVQGQ
jgi:tetratricopeptide (TPR) repeat protein